MSSWPGANLLSTEILNLITLSYKAAANNNETLHML
jgi:hypothetical protein